jgi:hypothetical protein
MVHVELARHQLLLPRGLGKRLEPFVERIGQELASSPLAFLWENER